MRVSRETSPYAESVNTPPRCISFADIRGDFKLLFTLLTQIFQVAKIENQKWEWTTTDTTLVCLGNFTDRYSRKGYNRLTISTDSAIQDQIRIIETFKQLQEGSKSENKNNNMVVLMGDHELGNILEWSHYEIYQMVDAESTLEQEQHIEFVKTILKPFCAQHGVVASWGLPGASVYFSHGSLDKDWFVKLRPNSLKDLNRTWQRWLRNNNFLRLQHFAEPNSPIMSTRMAMQPQLWREYDEETILRVLGSDPNPRFVQAGIPVQILKNETWDPYMRIPRCTSMKGEIPTMLTSRNADGMDQIYFLHNAMADVFCSYDEDDRRPQGLQFDLIMNNNEAALYLECKVLMMSEDEYKIYLSERPLNSCSAPATELDPEEIKLSDDELLHFRPMIDTVTLSSLQKETDHITKVALILFSDDMKQVYVLEHTLDPSKWSIPRGDRNVGESDWEALRRIVKEQTGIENLKFLDGGEFFDHQNMRVWVKQTRQAVTFQPNRFYQRGEWINYQHIWTDKHIFLDRETKEIFHTMLRVGLIPPISETDPEEGEWDKQLRKWKLYRKSVSDNVQEKWKRAKSSKGLKRAAIGVGVTAAVVTAPFWGPVVVKGLLIGAASSGAGMGIGSIGNTGGPGGVFFSSSSSSSSSSSQKPQNKTNQEKQEEKKFESS
jgi:ADP-ribose pyrophosphatase YjhB (NUDIX family)